MAFVKVYPLDATNISASTVQLTSNWAAIESTFASGHVSLDSALSGTHLYGRVSTMFSGTYANISALSSPASGALAIDTECGVCRLYYGSWVRITGDTFSRAHLYSTDTQAIPTVAWTQVVLDTESYDSLEEVSNSSITVVSDGYYLVIGNITWPTEAANNYQKAVGLYKGATRITTDVKYGKEYKETELVDIVALSADDVLTLKAYHTYGSNVSIVTANLILTRLS